MEELKSLVTRGRAGDLDAYGEIVRRFQDMAYGYAYSILGDFHLAEDAAQEAFIEAYRCLDNLREPAAFPGWFRRIVFKHCDRLRRRKQIPVAPLDAAAEVASADRSPPERAEDREMRDKVLVAIRSLPEHERTATTLFYINGYSQNDIAEFLEVPAGTVKSRLAASRSRLKERMITMVEDTLKENALPEDFADRLLRFPFPRTEPNLDIEDLLDETMSVRCTDAQTHFTPLTEHGASDWCFYDFPGAYLKGVNENRVVSCSKRGEQTILRIWSHYTELQPEEHEEWKENHVVLQDDTWRWVQVKRPQPAKLVLNRYKWSGDPEGCFSQPEPMQLEIGTEWISGDGTSKVVGVSRVTIGEQSWKSLKVLCAAQRGKTKDGTPTVLAEWYVNEAGRTIFFRRYNGAGYAASHKPSSFESLEGNLEIEFEGRPFRHFYDCIPDIALQKAFG